MFQCVSKTLDLNWRNDQDRAWKRISPVAPKLSRHGLGWNLVTTRTVKKRDRKQTQAISNHHADSNVTSVFKRMHIVVS